MADRFRDPLLDAMLPEIPPAWRHAIHSTQDLDMWTSPKGVHVLGSIELDDDGKSLVLHLSVSAGRRALTVLEEHLMRRVFLGGGDCERSPGRGCVHFYRAVPEAVAESHAVAPRE